MIVAELSNRFARFVRFTEIKVKARSNFTEFSPKTSMESESQEYIHENETDRPMEHSPRGRYIRVRIRFFGAIVSII